MRTIRFRGFIKYPSDIINGFWYGDLIHYANGDIYIFDKLKQAWKTK